jgi:hypothetical protein
VKLRIDSMLPRPIKGFISVRVQVFSRRACQLGMILYLHSATFG